MEGQRALGMHQKYLNLCSEDKQRSYRFGTTWGWVINDRIFQWTIPLTSQKQIQFKKWAWERWCNFFLVSKNWLLKSKYIGNVNNFAKQTVESQFPMSLLCKTTGHTLNQYHETCYLKCYFKFRSSWFYIDWSLTVFTLESHSFIFSNGYNKNILL